MLRQVALVFVAVLIVLLFVDESLQKKHRRESVSFQDANFIGVLRVVANNKVLPLLLFGFFINVTIYIGPASGSGLEHCYLLTPCSINPVFQAAIPLVTRPYWILLCPEGSMSGPWPHISAASGFSMFQAKTRLVDCHGTFVFMLSHSHTTRLPLSSLQHTLL